MFNLEGIARGGEVEDGRIFNVGAEVGPVDIRLGTLLAVARCEVTLDGDTRVLGDRRFCEDLTTGFVQESLHRQNLTKRVFPLVHVVTFT